MLFETAGIEVAPWVPPVAAFTISFFTSMGGVSGAFLLLPFQVSFLGYTNPSVSSTNQLFNIVAIPSGVFRYHREGRMVWPLTGLVVVGTIPGVFLGAIVRVAYLPDPQNFRLFAAVVMLCIGLRMIQDLLRSRIQGLKRPAGKMEEPTELVHDSRGKGAGSVAADQEPLAAVKVIGFSRKGLRYAYCGEQFEVPLWGVFALGLVVGIVGGVYGIGGGAIIAPMLVTFFRLPVHTVAGAALMGTFITSVAAVAFYQAIAPLYPDMSVAPDWLLGLLFGVGGMGGMYLGARCQKYVPARAIKWMLAGVTVLTGARYAAAFLGL